MNSGDCDHDSRVPGSEGAAEGDDGARSPRWLRYALLLALIAVVCIGAVTFLGNATADSYSDLGASLN